MTNTFKPQKKFEDKQRAKGFVRLTVWVPEEKRNEIRKEASNLCKKSKR